LVWRPFLVSRVITAPIPSRLLLRPLRRNATDLPMPEI
jgi:hypothetical protein